MSDKQNNPPEQRVWGAGPILAIAGVSMFFTVVSCSILFLCNTGVISVDLPITFQSLAGAFNNHSVYVFIILWLIYSIFISIIFGMWLVVTYLANNPPQPNPTQ